MDTGYELKVSKGLAIWSSAKLLSSALHSRAKLKILWANYRGYTNTEQQQKQQQEQNRKRDRSEASKVILI
jgi:hypothetical protein